MIGPKGVLPFPYKLGIYKVVIILAVPFQMSSCEQRPCEGLNDWEVIVDCEPVSTRVSNTHTLNKYI